MIISRFFIGMVLMLRQQDANFFIFKKLMPLFGRQQTGENDDLQEHEHAGRYSTGIHAQTPWRLDIGNYLSISRFET